MDSPAQTRTTIDSVKARIGSAVRHRLKIRKPESGAWLARCSCGHRYRTVRGNEPWVPGDQSRIEIRRCTGRTRRELGECVTPWFVLMIVGIVATIAIPCVIDDARRK